ncbi:MAG: thioredoxin fold domain-containing protein [Rhodocyclaceae bacterium]|nr:thioredoxin fold domain-containing protein [Rhodocyclaceae bacterium]
MRAFLKYLYGFLLILWMAPALSQAMGEYEMPAWFKESFLDLREDVEEAAKAGRRLLLYFHQDGCPYCARLLRENFGDRTIAETTRKHFDVIALNLWGDREVTDLAGRTLSEKAFARALRVQFTPTLVFLDEKGEVALRLNGYLPPHQFAAALDYVARRLEKKQAFTDYLLTHAREAASGKLHEEPWLMPLPLDLSRREGKPLLVLFEQKVCAACDELHREGFKRPEVVELLQKFRIARLDIAAPDALTTPAGKKSTMRNWAREMKIVYTPTLAFFDGSGKEIFRVEGYLRPFHLASSLAYVASGAYREQPEFQRYLEARARERRARGEKVELLQ